MDENLARVMSSEPLVYVIDDDASVRRSLARYLRVSDYRVETYPSAEEFLANPTMAEYGCIILDLRMPGLSGEGLQERLGTMEGALPVIIITGHGDARVRTRVMERGAVAFLAKPFDDEELLEAIAAALVRNSREVKERGNRG